MRINRNKNLVYYFIFLILSFLLTWNFFLSDGILLGGDYNFPYSKIQAESYFTTFSNSWHGANLGSRSIGLSSLPLAFAIKSFSSLGLSPIIFPKIFILALFSIAGFGIFNLLHFLKKDGSNSLAFFIGGLIYITSPLFFNYTIIGWHFVILTMALFPFTIKYFIKSVRGGCFYDIVILNFLIFFSIQTQAILWHILCFFALSFYLIKDKSSFLSFLRTMISVILFFFLFNSFWLLGILLYPDSGVYGSNIVNSPVSIGTAGHLYPSNIIRLFGSLFNYQFETVIENLHLTLFSFFIGVLVFGSLFLRNNRQKIISFLIIGIIPLFFYFLNFFRDILIYIPFSNVIRDFARFMVLPTFGYSILVALVLNHLLSNKNPSLRKLGFVSIIIILVGAAPWWLGELTNWSNSRGADMRLRTKVFHNDYLEGEILLSSKKLDQKVLYLPLGGVIDFIDDKKFSGAYNEAQDIFAGYSPISGIISMSDKNNASSVKYLLEMNKQLSNIFYILKTTNVRYIAIREDAKFTNKQNDFRNSKNNNDFPKYFNSKVLSIYKKSIFLPHFFIPSDLAFSKRDVNEIPRITSRIDWQTRSAIFFENQNTGKISTLSSLKDKIYRENYLPTLEFKKINPTKYRIRVHSAKGEFPLVFSESFHEGWKAYLVNQGVDSRLRGNDNISLDNYKILDGNKEDQASISELKEYIQKGWVTNLGDRKERKIEHQKWNEEKQKEELDYIEKYNIDFISKNFQGTIQNDNLPKGHFWETWFQDPIENNENHLVANGYANSWVIDSENLCQAPTSPPPAEAWHWRAGQPSPRAGEGDSKCVKNPDGSYDFELVVEFWPQRLFYIGLGISGLTLLGCVGYLGFDWYKRRKSTG